MGCHLDDGGRDDLELSLFIDFPQMGVGQMWNVSRFTLSTLVRCSRNAGDLFCFFSIPS